MQRAQGQDMKLESYQFLRDLGGLIKRFGFYINGSGTYFRQGSDIITFVSVNDSFTCNVWK